MKNKLLAYKLHILLSILCVLLVGFFVYQIFDRYSFDSRQNIVTAEQNKQRVILDLENHDVYWSLAELKSGEAEKRLETLEREEFEKEISQLPPTASEIAIVITELGTNKDSTKRAIALHPTYSLSFSPYAQGSSIFAQQAEDAGHLVLVGLPMQLKNADKVTVGRLGLFNSNSDFKNTQNFEAVLSKVRNAKGVVTKPNEIFSDTQSFEVIMKKLAEKNLGIVYTKENKDLPIEASDLGIEFTEADIVLDEGFSEREIRDKLKLAEKITDKKGFAVVVMKPYPVMLDLTEEWVKTFPEKKIRFVPALVND